MRRLALLLAVLALAGCASEDVPVEAASPSTVAELQPSTEDPAPFVDPDTGEASQGVFVPVGRPIVSTPQDPAAASDPAVVAICDRVDDAVATATSTRPWTAEDATAVSDLISGIMADLNDLLDEHGESWNDALYDCADGFQAING